LHEAQQCRFSVTSTLYPFSCAFCLVRLPVSQKQIPVQKLVLSFPTFLQDHPIHCAPNMPVLQYSIVNTTSPQTGVPLDVDPRLHICSHNSDHGKEYLSTCVGYTRGYTLPSNDVWELAAPLPVLELFSACIVRSSDLQPWHLQDGAEAANLSDLSSVVLCGKARVEAVVWRGAFTGMANGWSSKTSRKARATWFSQLMLNKRLRMTLLADLYPWLDFSWTEGINPQVMPWGADPQVTPFVVFHAQCSHCLALGPFFAASSLTSRCLSSAE
jgi:hypothetical protein